MIERAPFGATGHESSRVIFGAAALGGMSQDRANTTLGAIQEWGINHIDTAAARPRRWPPPRSNGNVLIQKPLESAYARLA